MTLPPRLRTFLDLAALMPSEVYFGVGVCIALSAAKLFGLRDIPWWLATAPLWLPIALFLSLALLVNVVAAIEGED